MVHLGAGTQAGFDEPLRLLSDCHRRIEHFLSILLKVADKQPGGPLNQEYRRALEAAMQYFKNAAPRHQADEEQSLFPRLRDRKDENIRRVLSEIDRLECDHEIAAEFHRRIKTIVEEWLREGLLAPVQRARLSVLLRILEFLYSQHIALEDRKLFPLVAHVLSSADIRAIGREMASRRGLNFERSTRE